MTDYFIRANPANNKEMAVYDAAGNRVSSTHEDPMKISSYIYDVAKAGTIGIQTGADTITVDAANLRTNGLGRYVGHLQQCVQTAALDSNIGKKVASSLEERDAFLAKIVNWWQK